jgi:hypothetical protein
MSMNEFRRLAARMDQQMQQLAAEGVSEAQAIIHRMMGHVPDLHRIWVSTSDQQLMALCREFPTFHRYARIMEEASEAEHNKASRPYDGLAEFSEQHQQMGAQLLTMAATLERGYLMPGATCKSSSHISRIWGDGIGNGCPTWTTSKAHSVRRAQNPRCWTT